MVNQFSNAVITFLFNIILMRLAGPNGVAAITILLYGQFLFNAFYLGFPLGSARSWDISTVPKIGRS